MPLVVDSVTLSEGLSMTGLEFADTPPTKRESSPLDLLRG